MLTALSIKDYYQKFEAEYDQDFNFNNQFMGDVGKIMNLMNLLKHDET